MKVLVTGANGFLGRRVVDAYLAAGHSVRALVRPASNVSHLNWGAGVEVFRADLRGGNELEPALAGVDAVAHLATQMVGDDFTILSGTLTGTERLFAAMAQAEVKRLVLISSFSVYDWRKPKGQHDESTSLLARPEDGGGYALAKRWQERMAREAADDHGWDLVVLRPGFIWGRGNDDLPCIGQRVGGTYLVFGGGRELALTHVANCADAVVKATEVERARGQTLDVIDGHRVSASRYARDWIAGTGGAARTLALPYRLVRLGVSALNLVSRMLFDGKGKLPSMFVPVRFELRYKPLRFRNDRIVEVLGWKPPHDYAECVQRTWSEERRQAPRQAA